MTAIKEVKVTEIKQCLQCYVDLQITNTGELVCPTCGIEHSDNRETYRNNTSTDCNVNSNCFIDVSIVGKNSYKLNKELMIACADQTKYRKVNILKEVLKWNNESSFEIPKPVLDNAVAMFESIKKLGYVFRKDNKNGVLGACISYECNSQKISRTPSEVAGFCMTEEKYLSFGDRVLLDLNERGLISIPVMFSPIVDYIDRYMIILDIPVIYNYRDVAVNCREFIISLIDTAERKYIHVVHDSQAHTKAVGGIYILTRRIPDFKRRIEKERIEDVCNISKTTFENYMNVVYNYHLKFKKVFKRHHVPMPIEWK